MGLYDEEMNLVVETGAFTNAIAGWNDIRIPNSYVTAGTYYVAAQVEGNWVFIFNASGPYYTFQHPTGGGAFPASMIGTYNEYSQGYGLRLSYCAP